MNTLLIIGFIIVIVYSCVSWVLPTLLAWLFMRKFNIKLKIGRIAVPKLILKDVSLSKDRFSIHINEVSFQSSCFNSEINKLVWVVVRGLEVSNQAEERRSAVVDTLLKPLLSKHTSPQPSTVQDAFSGPSNTQLLDFRDKKLPPSLITFAQFMGVEVESASVCVRAGRWRVVGAGGARAGGAGGGPALLLSARASPASLRLLHADRCLAELSCELQLEAAVAADGPFNLEKVHASMSSTRIRVEDELYEVVRQGGRRGSEDAPEDAPDHLASLVPRLSPIVPKIFSFKIDSTSVTCASSSTNTELELAVDSLQVTSRYSGGAGDAAGDAAGGEGSGAPQVYVALQADRCVATLQRLPLLQLDKLKLDAKLEKGVLNVYLIGSALHLTYEHAPATRWQGPARAPPARPAAWRARAARVAAACGARGGAACAELRGVTLAARVAPARRLLAGCSGLKLKLDAAADARDEWSGGATRGGLGAELLLDGGWARFPLDERPGAPAPPPARRLHAWRELLVAVALVKWARHAGSEDKVEAMLDCVRLEWSPHIAATLRSAAQCAARWRRGGGAAPGGAQGGARPALSVALSHVNLFCVGSERACVGARMDAATLELGARKGSAVVSGVKLLDLEPYSDPVPCQRSDEIAATFFHIKLARIEYSGAPAALLVQLEESVDVDWSVNMHLKVLTLVRAATEFLHELRGSGGGGGGSGGGGGPRRVDWRLSCKGDTNVGLILSEDNNMLFTTDDLTVAWSQEAGVSVEWGSVRVLLNGEALARLEGLALRRGLGDSDVRLERAAADLSLPCNTVWSVSICSVRVVFPYRHRFAEAVQGELLTAVKWLRRLHGAARRDAPAPLPPDLHVQIEEVLIEMSDDPFEVKLRDNYELLEDEYKESQKRRSMLDAKVAELGGGQLFLPAGRVEALYAALRRKDAQIYVQRCRGGPPRRTRLVACCLARLRVLALADPALHGAHNAQARLRELDPDSPWPEEGLAFTTLWCRSLSLTCATWQLLLRDFPQPLLRMTDLRMWGTLLAAEETPPPRAVREVTVQQGAGWGTCTLERSMMPLKWYYDLCCELNEFSYAFGPCWEPVIAQCNLAFEQVSRPSLDPSAPLAWWDRARLTLHGRLTLQAARASCLLHVSLDPYNTTEEMELTWTDLVLDSTNGKLGFLGTLDVYVRTASKYDDCRVLHVPGLRLGVKLSWACVADARDHHAVAPCAPTRLPEYSSNQEHDSYRAFRSQGLDLHLSLDTKPAAEGGGPVLLLYGSTLRWLESLKLILSGVTRPTRRGRVFRNVRARKATLSRHYRALGVSLALHRVALCYWASSSLQRGAELQAARVTCSCKQRLTLERAPDALRRRARAAWDVVYLNCDLNDAELWLKSRAAGAGGGGEGAALAQWYALSVRRVSYGRSAGAAPTHRLAVHDLRGAWTKLNRDLAFALIDTYIKTQQLKKNLSTKALKEEEEQPPSSEAAQRTGGGEVTSPAARGAGGAGAGGGDMLAALVAEAGGAAPVVFSDEVPADTPAPPARLLDDDSAHTACLLELVNSQVVLKGSDTRGYVLLCAARAEVRQRVRGRSVAWCGALSAMQYYATVSAADRDQLDENIQWVSVEEISERGAGAPISTLPDVPRLVGSGHSAGGVLGRLVGPGAHSPAQLQRIVSRCACEFYLDTHEGEDSFSLMHHDLNVCTNSLQYAMLLDVLNNVVLHVEPERRRTLERRARMRFQLQLHQDQDPRQLIHKLQTQVRESLARLRRLEKEYYLKNRSMTGDDPAALLELKSLDDQVNECKESVWSLGEELDGMVRAWREAGRAPPAPRAPHAPPAPPHRYNEICFKSARWRLTDADGQLGIADLLLTNFLYTKTSRSDDSVEHQLEVGYVRVQNLLPNEPFPEVLVPQEASGKLPLARRAALRVFCRDRPPVGGIAVKEHFEVNVVPLKIGLTKKFFNTMLKFCFPERDPDSMEDGDEESEGTLKAGTSTSGLGSSGSKKIKKKSKDSNSNFYVKRDKKDKDDVEKMKERAEKNKLFIYIKIPEVGVRVSYKGSKEKNLEDVRDLLLVLPTLEYHNVTWTWLDLLLATKSYTRRMILSQAIRQKLQLQRRAAAPPDPLEEDKARLLLGDRTMSESKPQKKGAPSVFKFSKS